MKNIVLRIQAIKIFMPKTGFRSLLPLHFNIDFVQLNSKPLQLAVVYFTNVKYRSTLVKNLHYETVGYPSINP